MGDQVLCLYHVLHKFFFLFFGLEVERKILIMSCNVALNNLKFLREKLYVLTTLTFSILLFSFKINIILVLHY